MKKFMITAVAAVMMLSAFGKPDREKPKYKNAKLPVEVRVQDLLRRMTLKEKIGQLRCTLAWNYYELKDGRMMPSEQFKKDIGQDNVGMLWATFRADPWTKKSLQNGLNPVLAAKVSNMLQEYAVKHTRLGIPLFLAEEAPHGHMAIGTTVFPTGLGMAATFSTELLESAGEVIAKEIRLQGGHISYGPVLDLCRDPRWSRVEEAFGEDPCLSAELGSAMVRGLVRNQSYGKFYTLPTLKHFIGYGTTEGGQNGNPTFLGQREIIENFLPPFKQAVEAGALSVMTSYNSLDGIPSTMNRMLLTDILRHQWAFRGFVVSDLYSVDGIYQTHNVTPTLQAAAVASMAAGVDVDLGGLAYKELEAAVESHSIEESRIDTAVTRVLRQKFQMGLFEQPYVKPTDAEQVRSAENRAIAYRVALNSITLLENKHNILPLKSGMKVAVVGPNADNMYNQLGDYTAPQDRNNVKTVLDGILGKLPKENVFYAKGCAIRDTTSSNIAEAVRVASLSDVVIAVVGGSSARDFKTVYHDTGAAVANETLSDMESGEGFDRANLFLLGHQMKLLQCLKATGKPLVVVYIEGRPLDKSWAKENADALLTAYYPGQEGGRAVADVLFGAYNPSGRLPISVPRNVGQLPVYYNKKLPIPHDYVESSAKPLYAFGYGLSYTRFAYSGLSITKTSRNTYRLTCNVTNIGERDGEEVVQFYVHDRVASVVQPTLQLKRFQKVMIPAGQTMQVEVELTADDLSIVGQDYKRVLEPGEFDILVGSSSDNILLRGVLTVSNS